MHDQTILPLQDTPRLYGRITRLLHWSMTLLILWEFLGMGLLRLLGRDSIAAAIASLHQPIGTVLFVLIMARIIWAFANRKRRPPRGEGLSGVASRLGHLALYLLMLLVPGIALIRAWGSEHAFAPFGFEIFPARAEAIEWTGTLAGALHGELGWVMAVLILGHVIMASLHQALWRDGTLLRMAGRGRVPRSA